MSIFTNNDLKSAEEFIRNNNNVFYANQYAIESFGKLSWNINDKKNSPVIGILLKHEKQIKSYNMNLNQAVQAICAVYHSTNSNTFFRLPDRFMAIRSQTSKLAIDNLINCLRFSELIEIKYYDGHTNIKLNRKMIEKDPYISKQLNRFKQIDKYQLYKCRKEFETIYYEDYCYEILRKHKRVGVIGMIEGFNRIGKPILTSEFRKQMIRTYGERTDIQYYEVPIISIAMRLNCSIEKAWQYIKMLCKHTDYMSVHDKVYQSTDTINNFYNENYKTQNPLVKVSEAKLNNTHPQVTPYSIIIHTDKYYKSNTYKEINKHIDRFIQTIIYDAQILKLNNYKYENTLIPFSEVNVMTDIKNTTKKRSVYSDDLLRAPREELEYSKELAKLDINALKKKSNKVVNYVPRIKLPENLNTISLSECTHLIKRFYYKLYPKKKESNVPDKDINYYINGFASLQNIFVNILNSIKKTNQVSYKHLINKYSTDEVLSVVLNTAI